MADNVTVPSVATGPVIATDEIDGAQYQRVKLIHGSEGVNAGDVSEGNPLPMRSDRSDDLLAMLQRLLKTLESNATVDAQQRQRITLDAISAALTLATVTTVGTVSSITAGTLTNLVANAGMDREQYINIARNTYANAIRSKLTFE